MFRICTMRLIADMRQRGFPLAINNINGSMAVSCHMDCTSVTLLAFFSASCACHDRIDKLWLGGVFGDNAMRRHSVRIHGRILPVAMLLLGSINEFVNVGFEQDKTGQLFLCYIDHNSPDGKTRRGLGSGDNQPSIHQMLPITMV